MPIIKYKCKDCGLTVERLQDDPESQLVFCPGDLREDEECGNKGNSTVLRKIIGKPSAHFKGDGFHSTDYDDSSNPASNNN